MRDHDTLHHSLLSFLTTKGTDSSRSGFIPNLVNLWSNWIPRFFGACLRFTKSDFLCENGPQKRSRSDSVFCIGMLGTLQTALLRGQLVSCCLSHQSVLGGDGNAGGGREEPLLSRLLAAPVSIAPVMTRSPQRSLLTGFHGFSACSERVSFQLLGAHISEARVPALQAPPWVL